MRFIRMRLGFTSVLAMAVLVGCGGGGSDPPPTPEPRAWTVSTLAGSGLSGHVDGAGAAAQFNRPMGVAVDAGGNVYVADTDNHRIRRITPAGVVSTLAAVDSDSWLEQLGMGAGQFYHPTGVAADNGGNVYVADSRNYRVGKKITPAGAASTLARGFGVAVPGTSAGGFPISVTVDASGHVYVADSFNHRIYKITPTGGMSTLAGSGIAGFADGLGSAAQFNITWGVAEDNGGNVHVADSLKHRIRKVSP